MMWFGGSPSAPTGTRLASASVDRTVIPWNWEGGLKLRQRLADACDWLRGYQKTHTLAAIKEDDSDEVDRDPCEGVPPPEEEPPAVAEAPTAQPTGDAAPSMTTAPTKTPQVMRDCSVCPEMIEVPAGSFMMGSPVTDRDAETTRSRSTRSRLPNPSRSAGTNNFRRMGRLSPTEDATVSAPMMKTGAEAVIPSSM